VKKQKNGLPPRENTAVYVTGLPHDVTVEEVHEVFSRKCGVIA
jgi:HIV Tat-specific factor 1